MGFEMEATDIRAETVAPPPFQAPSRAVRHRSVRPCGRTTGMRATPGMPGREKMELLRGPRFVMDHLVPAMGAPSGMREVHEMGPGRL